MKYFYFSVRYNQEKNLSLLQHTYICRSTPFSFWFIIATKTWSNDVEHTVYMLTKFCYSEHIFGDYNESKSIFSYIIIQDYANVSDIWFKKQPFMFWKRYNSLLNFNCIKCYINSNKLPFHHVYISPTK